jgi:regulation of enolase protein 1 (concanavalin A-like superfamily)
MGDLFGIRMCAAYTTESRITFNLEYHFNQAGFARADWRNWFAAGHASPGRVVHSGC